MRPTLLTSGHWPSICAHGGYNKRQLKGFTTHKGRPQECFIRGLTPLKSRRGLESMGKVNARGCGHLERGGADTRAYYCRERVGKGPGLLGSWGRCSARLLIHAAIKWSSETTI